MNPTPTVPEPSQASLNGPLDQNIQRAQALLQHAHYHRINVIPRRQHNTGSLREPSIREDVRLTHVPATGTEPQK